ncbi:MAG: carbon monoxide dehydrogenase subunit G [Rhodospirillaceae bacterium]
MELKEERRIAAPRDVVFAALNDPDMLARAIPGCDSLEKISDTEFKAVVTAKVGPVRAKFSGQVRLSDINPPVGYTIFGDGKGGAAGFAKGGAIITLTEDGDATVMIYEVKADVGGKLAQLGARLIEGTSKKLAGEFFDTFEALVAESAAGQGAEETEAAPAVQSAPIAPAAPKISETGPWILGPVLGFAVAIWVIGLVLGG